MLLLYCYGGWDLSESSGSLSPARAQVLKHYMVLGARFRGRNLEQIGSVGELIGATSKGLGLGGVGALVTLTSNLCSQAICFRSHSSPTPPCPPKPKVGFLLKSHFEEFF